MLLNPNPCMYFSSFHNANDLLQCAEIICLSQEEYIKEEQRSLKRELLRAQEEVKRIQAVPLVIGQFLEMIDRNSGIIGSTTGSNYYVRILSTLNRELLKPSSSVALHRHSNALVDILPPEADSSISLLSQSERPDVTYQVSTAAVCFQIYDPKHLSLAILHHDPNSSHQLFLA